MELGQIAPLVYLLHTRRMTEKKQLKVKAINLNIAKAFDRVWHRVRTWIRFLRSSLGIDFSFSPSPNIACLRRWAIHIFFRRNTAIPQGSGSSPKLFLLNVNYIRSSGSNNCYGDNHICVYFALDLRVAGEKFKEVVAVLSLSSTESRHLMGLLRIWLGSTGRKLKYLISSAKAL